MREYEWTEVSADVQSNTLSWVEFVAIYVHVGEFAVGVYGPKLGEGEWVAGEEPTYRAHGVA